MPNGGFSLSVSNRGLDVVIGGSGLLDKDGMAALREAIEESCKQQGATILLDLTGLTEFGSDFVSALVDAGDFCRGQGVPLTLSMSPEALRVLNDAGYSDELLPLSRGSASAVGRSPDARSRARSSPNGPEPRGTPSR